MMSKKFLSVGLGLFIAPAVLQFTATELRAGTKTFELDFSFGDGTIPPGSPPDARPLSERHGSLTIESLVDGVDAGIKDGAYSVLTFQCEGGTGGWAPWFVSADFHGGFTRASFTSLSVQISNNQVTGLFGGAASVSYAIGEPTVPEPYYYAESIELGAQTSTYSITECRRQWGQCHCQWTDALNDCSGALHTRSGADRTGGNWILAPGARPLLRNVKEAHEE